MGSCNEQDISSITPEDLVSTPAVHISICTEVLSSALPTGYSIKPRDSIVLSPAGTFKSSGGSAGARVNEDEINAMPGPTPSLVHFVLGNFILAMFLISLIIFIVFFAVTWLTVLRDARLMKDQVLSNATGVSISLLQRCALLTVIVVVGISARPHPPTKPRYIFVVHFMDSPCLRSAHHL